MAVFHESTINGLFQYGFRDTANRLRVFMKLWNVLNLKTTSIGKFKREITRDPVQSTDDWKLKYLVDMTTFFDRWHSSKLPGLTKETFLEFQQTSRAISSLAHYFIDDCGFNNVLLGLIQSDNIESRFGWYRQLSGANYFISIRQFKESDKKIRTISLLKYSDISIGDIDSVIMKKGTSAEIMGLADDIRGEMLFNYVSNSHDEKIIYYVCDALIRSVLRTKKCDACK